MANLSSISSLGTIDADTDFQVDFFVPSTSWESVRRREKPIAIGEGTRIVDRLPSETSSESD